MREDDKERKRGQERIEDRREDAGEISPGLPILDRDDFLEGIVHLSLAWALLAGIPLGTGELEPLNYGHRTYRNPGRRQGTVPR